MFALSKRGARSICRLVLLVCCCAPFAAHADDDPKRLPIPDPAARAEALNVIQSLRFPRSKKNLDDLVLEQAQECLKLGRETNDDPSGRYVLFCLARDNGARLGKPELAFGAAREISEVYEVEALRQGIAVLTVIQKAPLSGRDREEALRQTHLLVDLAIYKDEYTAARSLTNTAVAIAKQIRKPAHLKHAVARTKEVEEIAEEYAAAAPAMAKLKETPADPSMNTIAGGFLCLAKGDWKAGLPLLAISDRETMKELAALELDFSPDNLKLADGWWEIGDGVSGVRGTNARLHAAMFYRRALPKLTGLAKAKAESRIAEVEKQTADDVSPKDGSVVYLDDLQEAGSKVGHGTVGKHGRQGYDGNPAVVLDGRKAVHSISIHPDAKDFSWIAYRLDGAYDSFDALVGISEAAPRSSVSSLIFRLVGDGRILWKSAPLRRGRTQDCLVDVQGIQRLELQVHCPGNHDWAWAVWVEPRLSTK